MGESLNRIRQKRWFTKSYATRCIKSETSWKRRSRWTQIVPFTGPCETTDELACSVDIVTSKVPAYQQPMEKWKISKHWCIFVDDVHRGRFGNISVNTHYEKGNFHWAIDKSKLLISNGTRVLHIRKWHKPRKGEKEINILGWIGRTMPICVDCITYHGIWN